MVEILVAEKTLYSSKTSFSGETQSYHEAPKTLFRSKSLLLLFMLPGSLFICIHFMEIQSYFDFFYIS